MTVDHSEKKVLIFMLGSLGDTIVALPSFHLIARTFPNSKRFLLTNAPLNQKAPPAESVLGNSGLIHGCIRFDPKKKGGIWRNLFQIRRFKPDVVVYLMWIHRSAKALRRDALFFRFFSGASRIIGIPPSAEPRRRRTDGSGLYEPEAQRLARMIQVLGSAETEEIANWDLVLSHEEREKAAQVLGALDGQAFIVCGPGTKVQAKDWGQENWHALMGKLSACLPDRALVLVGAKEEFNTGEYVAQGWTGKTLNLTGQLTPRETAAVLSKSELFLGPDSGPMHLAAINGVPCAIAFSARDYAGAWYPVGDIHRIIYHKVDCMQCRLDVCLEQKKKCLTSITVDEMLSAALEARQNGQRARQNILAPKFG